MTIIGPSIETVITSTPPMGSVSQAISSPDYVKSGLAKSDSLMQSSVKGSIPATRSGIIGNISKGASNTANSIVQGTKDVGNVIIKDVLPKPEPLSTTMLRNRTLSALLIGGFTNGIKGIVSVIKGDYTTEQAMNKVTKDTAMGAVAGVSFVSGMGLTSTLMGGFMTGVPLSVAALTLGTLMSIGATELVNKYVPLFKKSE